MTRRERAAHIEHVEKVGRVGEIALRIVVRAADAVAVRVGRHGGRLAEDAVNLHGANLRILGEDVGRLRALASAIAIALASKGGGPSGRDWLRGGRWTCRP